MSKKPQKRTSPLRGPGGKGVDKSVQAVLDKAARLNGAAAEVVKVTVRLPADLVETLKREAHALTGHRRRGFSDLLVICARYGLEAYQSGDLEVERAGRVVQYGLVRSGGGGE